MPAQRRPIHPWVADRSERITFGVQAFARRDDPEPYTSIVSAGELVEALGFDGFFIGDHPAHAPEPHIILTAVAARTRRVRLGSIVVCAGYRHPVMTARLAADVDIISGGRFNLGLGIGWAESEFVQLGARLRPIPERQRALSETVEIVRRVWAGEPFRYEGEIYRVEAAEGNVRPFQQPEPPILIAGGGKRTLRQVAELADACNFGASERTGAVRSVEEVRARLAYLDECCAAIGRDPKSVLRTHFTSWLFLAPTTAEAREKRARYFPDGLAPEQEVTRLALGPDEAIAHYQALADAGMRQFVIQILDARDHETIRLLAEDVAPNITIRD